MAIYHLSVKAVSRSDGRSATAAAAYRAGVEITDERSGEIFDYRRKGGVESSELVLPTGAPDWAADRAALWNAAELAEKRKNSIVAREFEVALPDELTPDERQRLARDFARELVERHGCAADVALHAPSREGDERNYHAHILLTTRRLTPDGLGEKTRELDDKTTGARLVTEWRARWAALTNERLRDAGIDASIDHRSHAERGIDAVPTRHLGPAATGYERRTGQKSWLRLRHEAEAAERLACANDAQARADELADLELQAAAIDQSISDAAAELAAAQAVLAVLAEQRQAERRRFVEERMEEKKRQERQARQEAQDAKKAEQERLQAAAQAQAVQQAEQQATLARQQAQAAQERLRIDRMTAAELAAEIRRLRPEPVIVLVDRDPAVIRAEQRAVDLQRRQTDAQSAAAQARDAAEAWRKRHKIQVWFHDREFGYSPALRELEQQQAAADVQARTLRDRMAQADDELYAARAAAQRRIDADQAPVRAKLAELEQQRVELARQELELELEQRRQRAERRPERRRDNDQGQDYGDSGPGW